MHLLQRISILSTTISLAIISLHVETYLEGQIMSHMIFDEALQDLSGDQDSGENLEHSSRI